MCGEHYNIYDRKIGWRSKDPYVDYVNSQFFDYLNHINDGTCQRCGGKQGPFYTIDLNAEKNQDYELVTTMSMPKCNSIYLCKKCHTELKKWLDIPTQDVIF